MLTSTAGDFEKEEKRNHAKTTIRAKNQTASLRDRKPFAFFQGKKESVKNNAVEALLEHFHDEEKRQEYYEFFRELSDIYEILSPDAISESAGGEGD